jgi:hypothetical protein
MRQSQKKQAMLFQKKTQKSFSIEFRARSGQTIPADKSARVKVFCLLSFKKEDLPENYFATLSHARAFTQRCETCPVSSILNR